MGWALGCGVFSRVVKVCLVFCFVVLGCCWLFRVVAFLVLGDVLSVFLFCWALGCVFFGRGACLLKINAYLSKKKKNIAFD